MMWRMRASSAGNVRAPQHFTPLRPRRKTPPHPAYYMHTRSARRVYVMATHQEASWRVRGGGGGGGGGGRRADRK